MKFIKKIVFLLFVVVLGIVLFNFYTAKKNNANKKQEKDCISNYGYHLYSNSTKNYESLFFELKKVLSSDLIDEEKYVSIISKMFIIDFYTLNNKISNFDIGGVDFLHDSIAENFKLKAKETIYKYVKNDIYGRRNQQLPEVNEVIISDIITKPLNNGDYKDNNAYYVTVNWTYQKDLGYDTSKSMIFIHDGNKLSLISITD